MSNLDERIDTLRPTGLSPLLTTAQLMARYGASNWTVNRWVQKGCPLAPTAFRGRRFDLAKVEEWHAENATDAQSRRPTA
ncbi:hypothetical protein B1R27_30035 [Streptomyces sp. GKU 895]|nr:hypothetical protein B1R27_30035 [Streptomyces sp. GKU 895]